jgi:hypothetical protein
MIPVGGIFCVVDESFESVCRVNGPPANDSSRDRSSDRIVFPPRGRPVVATRLSIGWTATFEAWLLQKSGAPWTGRTREHAAENALSPRSFGAWDKSGAEGAADNRECPKATSFVSLVWDAGVSFHPGVLLTFL